jgi:hypothetical protein
MSISHPTNIGNASGAKIAVPDLKKWHTLLNPLQKHSNAFQKAFKEKVVLCYGVTS